MKRFNYLFICLLFIHFGCQQESTKTVVNPMESALPHGTNLGSLKLSQEDRLKLVNAKGKKAILIDKDELNSKIQSKFFGLQIYYFWNLSGETVQEDIMNLQRIVDELSPKSIQLHMVNMDSPERLDAVNLFIRENGIVSDVYNIQMDLQLKSEIVRKHWDGQNAGMLLVNNQDGTNLFYQSPYLYEELVAIISSVTI